MSRLEKLLFRYFQYLESKGSTFNVLLGLICTGAIGAFDLLAPNEATHLLLYILPIGFVTWFSGIRFGFGILLICTAIWSINNVVPNLLITSWNIISTFFSFMLIALLMHKTRKLWENEKLLSRIDPLTGAKNLRAFTELVEYEMLRSRREALPYSLAYLDLDNFKAVNDTYGHKAGDELLISIVATMVSHLRKTDIVGRVGGDEFAIFFPKTDQAAVQIVTEKITEELRNLAKGNKRATTFSMGVLTCNDGLHELDDLISFADRQMYEVKRSGKNNVRYVKYPPKGQELRLGW